MSYISAVIQILNGQVNGVNGLSDVRGISPVPLPQDAEFPYITVQELATKEEYTLIGRNGKSLSFIQVNYWHPDYETAWALRQAGRDALLAFRGTADSAVIEDVHTQVTAELYDPAREIHQLITRFAIWFDDATYSAPA